MMWLRRLFCRHDWRHHFLIDENGAAISCRCTKCSKVQKPSHYWPQPGDLIRNETPHELADDLKEGEQ